MTHAIHKPPGHRQIADNVHDAAVAGAGVGQA